MFIRAIRRIRVVTPIVPGARAMSTKVLQMPKIMSAKTGSLDKWIKKEGEAYTKGEAIAELTLDGVTIGLQLKEAGVLVKKLLNEGQVADVGADMALVAESEEAYLAYLDDLRVSTEEHEELMELEKSRVEAGKKNVTVLRHIKHMIQQGVLEDETDFVTALLARARDGDPKVISLFEASYEGSTYNEGTFDNSFFIENIEILLQMDSEKHHAEKGSPAETPKIKKDNSK